MLCHRRESVIYLIYKWDFVNFCIQNMGVTTINFRTITIGEKYELEKSVYATNSRKRL